MINPAKKGYTAEVEVVDFFKDLGLEAQRSWGSDGRSMRDKDGKTCESDVDILADLNNIQLKIQVKRRKKIAKFLQFKNCDIVATRPDRGSWTFIVNAATMKTLLLNTLGEETLKDKTLK
nr:Holliday junction resolvase - archaeal type (COG1591) [uncultured Mediterranean phage uvMED]